MFHWKLFYYVEIFRKKRLLVDVKAKYFLLKTKMRGVETEWRRLGDEVRGTETVFLGLEFILQIWRLGGHFCRAHGSSAHPPSFSFSFQVISFAVRLKSLSSIYKLSYRLVFRNFKNNFTFLNIFFKNSIGMLRSVGNCTVGLEICSLYRDVMMDLQDTKPTTLDLYVTKECWRKRCF